MTLDPWQLERRADNTVEDALFDVEVFDALNRFGRHAIAFIDDEGGEKFDHYPRGSAHDIYHPGQDPETDDPRLSGFVTERDEYDEDGADVLEVEIYSFDHYLRRNNVTREYTNQTRSSILQDIVEDFTPAFWEADNVNLVSDDEISRDFRGEKVDNAIREVLAGSANEDFGINDDIQFFAEPRETEEAPRGIDNTQWLDYDIPETGKESVNEVAVFYGEGGNEGHVVVTDGSDKKSLQDASGTDGPVTLREEVTREDIDNDQDAKRKGEAILSDRESTLTGTVTTFELFDAEPGQVLPVEIGPRGIDDDFRIAELDYEWGRDATTVTIVEKRGAQDETLVRLTDTLKRIEGRAADRDVPATIFEGPLSSRGLFRVTATVCTRLFGTERFIGGFGRDAFGFGQVDPGLHISEVIDNTEEQTRVTNALLNAVRSGWQDGSTPDITQISVGSGDSTPSRTDTGLDNRQADGPATVGTPGNTEAQFSATFVPGQAFDLLEAGLEETDATLFARLTVDSLTTQVGRDVDVTITVEALGDNTADGVITESGSELSRDIIADNSPSEATQIAFGEDDTEPQTSDTALGNEFSKEPIDEFDDREVGTVDVLGDVTNSSGSSVTLREWGLLDASDALLTRIVYADIILEDTDTMNATQRLRWRNE